MKKSAGGPPRPEGPAERIVRIGIRGAAPVDLLAVAISNSAEKAESAEDTARSLLRMYDIHHLGGVSKSQIHELTELPDYESLRLLAALELGRRSGLGAKGQLKEIRTADDIASLFDYLKDEQKEHFCVALLNTRHGVLGIRTVHVGTVNMSVVGVREVFRDALREGAASIAVAHNHPSGNPEPSEEDINVTHRLCAAGRLLEIPVLDHVIIGHHDFVSFARRGLLS